MAESRGHPRFLLCQFLLHCAILVFMVTSQQVSNDTSIAVTANTTEEEKDSRISNNSDPEQFFKQHQDCSGMYECPRPLETKSKVLPSWDILGCRCDDECTIYGDCCVNWATYNPSETKSARKRFKCVHLVTYQGIYLLSTCPSSWTDHGVRSLCETSHVGDGNTEDPLASIPVTSLETRFTYSNYFCAACNNDTERVVYWTPRVECGALHLYNETFGNITDKYVWQNLQFNKSSNTWGVHLPDSGSDRVDLGPFIPNPSFVPCGVVLQMPNSVEDLIRQCYPWIDSCPATWTNATVANLCQSYTAVVFNNYAGMPVFRNIHCAICNDQDLKELDCRSFPLYRNVPEYGFATSLAFLFDFNQDSGNVVGTDRRCPPGQLYDPFFRFCRQMVCLNSSFTLSQGRCVSHLSPVTSTSMSPSNVSSTSSSNTSFQGTTDKTDLLGCQLFNISQSDYKMYTNGSVYVSRYKRLFPPGEYISSIEGTIFVCPPMMDGDLDEYLYRRKFSLALAYVTLAGMGISVTCFFFHMLAFILVPSLRNLSGKNLMSLCVVLSVAYITFIVPQFNGIVTRTGCTVIGVTLYYCFLATFFWLNAIAFDVWRSLRQATSELRITAGQQWRKFVYYSTYAWLGPAIIVATSMIVENSPSVPHSLQPAFGKFTCWFGSRRALLVFFVGPVIAVLFVNVVLFILSAHIIISSTHSSAKLHPSNNARRNFSLYLRLALIMGLSWIFGIAAGQLDTQPLWYIFVILNTLQGLFIFLSFTCTEKVRTHLSEKVFSSVSSYYSSTQGTDPRSARKHGLEGRDSGSGESQSSQTSRTTLTNLSNQASNSSTDQLY